MIRASRARGGPRSGGCERRGPERGHEEEETENKERVGEDMTQKAKAWNISGLRKRHRRSSSAICENDKPQIRLRTHQKKPMHHRREADRNTK